MMNSPKMGIPTKAWLENEYTIKNRSARDIGKELSTYHSMVVKWLENYGITARRKKPTIKRSYLPSKEWMEEAYLIKQRSARDIGRELSVDHSVVLECLKRYGITARVDKFPRGLTPTKEWLENAYWNEWKNLRIIGEQYSVSSGTVEGWFKKYEIPVRSKKELGLPKGFHIPNKEWFEKAYLVEGETFETIGEILGFKGSRIRKWIVRHGIPIRSRSEASPRGEKNHWWKGGISTARGKVSRSPQWVKAMKQVKTRDRNLCRLCHSKGIIKKGEHIHHIDRFVEAFLLSCDPGNLILLCKDCHRKVTGRENRWKRRLFTLIDQPLTMQPFGAK